MPAVLEFSSKLIQTTYFSQSLVPEKVMVYYSEAMFCVQRSYKLGRTNEKHFRQLTVFRDLWRTQ